MVAATNYSTLLLEHESGPRQQVNKRAWLYSNKTSLMDTEFWILYNFHISGTFYIFIFFANHLKIRKSFLPHRPNKNEEGGFGWRAAVCQPLPGLYSPLSPTSHWSTVSKAGSRAQEGSHVCILSLYHLTPKRTAKWFNKSHTYYETCCCIKRSHTHGLTSCSSGYVKWKKQAIHQHIHHDPVRGFKIK